MTRTLRDANDIIKQMMNRTGTLQLSCLTYKSLSRAACFPIYAVPMKNFLIKSSFFESVFLIHLYKVSIKSGSEMGLHAMLICNLDYMFWPWDMIKRDGERWRDSGR